MTSYDDIIRCGNECIHEHGCPCRLAALERERLEREFAKAFERESTLPPPILRDEGAVEVSRWIPMTHTLYDQLKAQGMSLLGGFDDEDDEEESMTSERPPIQANPIHYIHEDEDGIWVSRADGSSARAEELDRADLLWVLAQVWEANKPAELRKGQGEPA